MTKNSPDNHLSIEALLDYSANLLSESRQCEIDEHLAECGDCTEQVRGYLETAAVIRKWNAGAHGMAFWSARLSSAIEQLESRPQPAVLRERLGQWRQRWTGQAEGVVRLVVEVPGHISRIVTDGMESLLRPGAGWVFAPVPVARPVRGAGSARLEGPSAPERARVVAACGHVRVRIAVDDAAGEVVVRVDGMPGVAPAPLVVLLPQDPGTAPLIGEPVEVPGAAYRIVRFTDTTPGQYLVVLEPGSASGL
jgi:hypothetical protein